MPQKRTLEQDGQQDDTPVKLSIDAAIRQLPNGPTIHTFRNPRVGLLVGADWHREDIVAAIHRYGGADVTGPSAQQINHGLAINDGSVLFIETTPEASHAQTDAGTGLATNGAVVAASGPGVAGPNAPVRAAGRAEKAHEHS